MLGEAHSGLVPHRHIPLISGRVPGAHSMVTFVSGGREEEKKKQPDREIDKTSTTISFCSIPLYSFLQLATLSYAREAIVF